MTHNAKIHRHGQILSCPEKKSAGTAQDVAYELGKCYQLDQKRCLLVASLDEQGGGDKCVGNDMFVFYRLSEIKAEKAIPLNRPDTEYKMKSGKRAWLSKYPATGMFLPLESKFPGAGSGLLVSTGKTFNGDGSSIDDDSETTVEFIQLEWTGSELAIRKNVYISSLCGFILTGVSPI